jgi:hypothetical protein
MFVSDNVLFLGVAQPEANDCQTFCFIGLLSIMLMEFFLRLVSHLRETFLAASDVDVLARGL